MITAIVMIDVEVDSIQEVAQAIADCDFVTEVYSVTGAIDLIAMVRVPAHDQLDEVITGTISKVPGVLATQSHVAFRAYSRHDLDAAFRLGVEN